MFLWEPVVVCSELPKGDTAALHHRQRMESVPIWGIHWWLSEPLQGEGTSHPKLSGSISHTEELQTAVKMRAACPQQTHLLALRQ